MFKHNFLRLLPGLYLIRDTCNVYLLCDGDKAVSIDFGSGKWAKSLGSFGIKQLDYVLLTHHHRDQCEGLLKFKKAKEVLAPSGANNFLTKESVSEYWAKQNAYPFVSGVLPKGLPSVKCRLGEGGDIFWGRHRIRFLPTPGHSPNALTVMVTWNGKNVFFCGDAVHAGGKIHQPYHLEWDHWTPRGALAAWYGLERLGYCGIDLLCPSHGAVIRGRKADACVKLTQKRLSAFIRAKGSVCSGEKDDYFPLEALDDMNARRVLPHLYQFGGNSYLLVSRTGDSLLVDPNRGDLSILDKLMPAAGAHKLSVAAATHFHSDHTDGFPLAKKKYGARSWMHPWIAGVLDKHKRSGLPFLPDKPIIADRILPETGKFEWNEYEFNIWPMPAQTRYHCAFLTVIDGQKVLFSGDSFQPPSRWNGTGGFCAANHCRFGDFLKSARLVMKVKPDIIANGHQAVYRFHASHYRRILRWADQAGKALRDLCVSRDYLKDYFTPPVYRLMKRAKKHL